MFSRGCVKQVPSCEFHLEAVEANVLGTENVLEAAIQNEVERVVALARIRLCSINAMGISKALMEK